MVSYESTFPALPALILLHVMEEQQQQGGVAYNFTVDLVHLTLLTRTQVPQVQVVPRVGTP